MRARVFSVALPLAALVGCQQQPARKEDNPVGTYQMLPGVNPASVAVLDTRHGTVQNCFLLQFRYHCLAQTTKSSVEGGLKEEQTQPASTRLSAPPTKMPP